ncbi:MAG TPA: amidohydrolase [Candidatus Acidoferrales bacterium]|nr:amidohydrolase [Candidatus Acidoferrales bacterium]
MAKSVLEPIVVPADVVQDVVALRRDIHAFPELGFEEVRTSGIVADRLRRLGYEVRTKIAQTGVLGILRTGKPGLTVLLRADMDALPLEEAPGLPFASTVRGKMHACGHDGHVAILLGAAQMIMQRRDALCGTIVLCFQPAEEGKGGAAAMVAEGVLDDPQVDKVYGLHVWSQHAPGIVLTRPGPMMATSDTIEITVRGKGGHGAQPDHTIDPIVTAAHFVNSVQTVVSRKVDPLEPAVVTIGAFNAGTAPNVIPEEARLLGTVRTFNEQLRDEMPQKIEAVLAGCCASANATYDYTYVKRYPITSNDPGEAAYVMSLAAGLLGSKRVAEQPKIMGAEDFSFMLQRRPGCFFFLGACVDPKVDAPHHSPHFAIDESAFATGVQMMVALATDAPRRSVSTRDTSQTR